MATGMREKTTNVGGVIKRIWYAMTGETQGAELLSIDEAGKLGLAGAVAKSQIQIGNKANIFNGANAPSTNWLDLGYNVYYNEGYRYTEGTGVSGDEAVLLEIEADGFGFYTADKGLANASAALTKRLQITKDVFKIPLLAGTGNRAVYSNSSGDLTNTSSDVRVKKNIQNITDNMNVLAALKNIRGVTYNWDNTIEGYEGAGEQQEIGVIAQEIEQYIPQVVGENATGYKSVDYAKIVAFLIETNKALLEKVEILESKVV